jgi:hypothetical protein
LRILCSLFYLVSKSKHHLKNIEFVNRAPILSL